MEWNCQNCKKGVKKGFPCDTCKNKEANWACTTCHFCNPTGNTMKRCGGGSNPAYWWYVPKGSLANAAIKKLAGDAITVTSITPKDSLANVEIKRLIGDV